MRSLAVVLLFAASAAAQDIVNVVDDFLRYHEACKSADAATRLARWDTMLEKKHREFFDHVLYRKAQGEQRQAQKSYCIRRFWSEMAGKLGEIAKVNRVAADRIRSTMAAFKKHFPDLKAGTDFYITIAFSFRGKVVDIGKRNVFAIGLEHFKADSPQLAITIAHELFHLYHFQTFRTAGGLYRTLWAEGMAVYASAVVIPGHRSSAYLGFSGGKMNKCNELLKGMAAELKRNMGSSDQRIKRIYFGAEKNETAIPPEAGYYVGLQMIARLAKQTPLKKLARLEAKQAWPLIERELVRLSK